MFSRFFFPRSPVTKRATEAFKLQQAKAEVRKKQLSGALTFDATKASESEILKWYDNYAFETSLVQHKQNLLKFGKMALRQIQQNRIPVDSVFASGTPPELLKPSASEDAVVEWYSQVLEKLTDTSAFDQFKEAQTPLSPKQIEQRETLLDYFKKNFPDLEVLTLTIPLLQALKKDLAEEATNAKSAEAEAKRAAQALARQAAEEAKNAKSAEAEAKRAAQALARQAAQEAKTAKAAEAEAKRAAQALAREAAEEAKAAKAAEADAKRAAQALARQAAEDAKNARKAETLAKREAQAKERYYQKLHNARLTAGRQHKRGKITNFDYRETDDETILAWYADFKKREKF